MSNTKPIYPCPADPILRQHTATRSTFTSRLVSTKLRCESPIHIKWRHIQDTHHQRESTPPRNCWHITLLWKWNRFDNIGCTMITCHRTVHRNRSNSPSDNMIAQLLCHRPGRHHPIHCKQNAPTHSQRHILPDPLGISSWTTNQLTHHPTQNQNHLPWTEQSTSTAQSSKQSCHQPPKPKPAHYSTMQKMPPPCGSLSLKWDTPKN